LYNNGISKITRNSNMRNSKKMTKEERRQKLAARQKDIGKGKKKDLNRHLDFSVCDKEVTFYKPEVTKKGAEDIYNSIDIVPYYISSENHPEIDNGMEIGDEDYYLNYSIHRNIGTDNKTFICLSKTYNKKCPICEERERIFREKDGKSEEEIKVIGRALKAKERVLFNVIDKNDDADNNIKLYDVSPYVFSTDMLKAFKRAQKEGPARYIADIEEGPTITFIAEEEKADGFVYYKATTFEFKDREEVYSEEIIDSAYPLDEFLVVHTYKEIEAALFGYDNDQEDEEYDNEEDMEYPEEDLEYEEEEEVVEEEQPQRPKRKKKVVEEEEKVDCPAHLDFGMDYDATDETCKECEHKRECKKKTLGG
jgi:hypothetical protein